MYDHVIQYGFDKNSENIIEKLKSHLKSNDILDKEREWIAHITIDLYKCENKNYFLMNVDKVIKKLKTFNINFNNLNSFFNETLYLEPNNKTILYNNKVIFDSLINEFRLDKRKMKEHHPYVILCTTNKLEKATTLVLQKFQLFKAKVNHIWVYSRDMKLIKDYFLGGQ